MSNLATEYDRDFDAWIQQHIALLMQGRVTEIDVDHLIEELEDMGKNNRHELVSRFVLLISHLLKWEYQYSQLQDRWGSFTGGSWKGIISVQRSEIIDRLEQSPNLKRQLSESVIKAYPKAVKIATKETSLPNSTFPENCPYTIEQLLDDDFYPKPKD